MQWWERPSVYLVPWIHFSSFLLSSVAGYALYWGLKTLCVSLFILVFALKHCYPFYLKQLAETVGFWKIIWTQQKPNVKRWVLAHWAKLLPSPTIPVTHSQREPFAFSALLELLIVLSLQNTTPLMHPRAPVFICSVSGKAFAMTWLMLSHVGLAWHLSEGAVSSFPFQHEMCCSWPCNCLSQPKPFNVAWVSHGEEFLSFFLIG